MQNAHRKDTTPSKQGESALGIQENPRDEVSLHAPMPSKINAETLPMLIRHLWGPAFDFAEFAVTQVLERVDIEILNKALATQVVPHGMNSVLGTVSQVVNLSGYRYDPR